MRCIEVLARAGLVVTFFLGATAARASCRVDSFSLGRFLNSDLTVFAPVNAAPDVIASGRRGSLRISGCGPGSYTLRLSGNGSRGAIRAVSRLGSVDLVAFAVANNGRTVSPLVDLTQGLPVSDGGTVDVVFGFASNSGALRVGDYAADFIARFDPL